MSAAYQGSRANSVLVSSVNLDTINDFYTTSSRNAKWKTRASLSLFLSSSINLAETLTYFLGYCTYRRCLSTILGLFCSSWPPSILRSYKYYLSTYLPTSLPTYLPTCLPTCLSTYLSIHLSTFLPNCIVRGNANPCEKFRNAWKSILSFFQTQLFIIISLQRWICGEKISGGIKMKKKKGERGTERAIAFAFFRVTSPRSCENLEWHGPWRNFAYDARRFLRIGRYVSTRRRRGWRVSGYISSCPASDISRLFRNERFVVHYFSSSSFSFSSPHPAAQ